jgi:hypothetical protein
MKRVLAIVVAAACGGGAGGSGGSAAHDFCVSETNRYRQTIGNPALVHSAEIEAYADEGAEVDFETSPHNHFTSTGGGGIAFAENECPAQLGWMLAPGEDVTSAVGRCIKAFYDEGPGGGHYQNLMGPYTKVGCGIFDGGGKITIVQDFGN